MKECFSAFFFFIITFGFFQQVSAQNLILNGGFENNTASSTTGDLQNANDFNSVITDVFFIQGELRLFINDSSTCTQSQEGHWMIGESNDYYHGSFGFVLAQNLLQGHTYKLTFADQSCIGNYGDRWIDIGLSNNPAEFGDVIAHITEGFDTFWTDQELIFSPAVDESFLTVKLLEEYAGWNAGLHADNFILTDLINGISETEISLLYPYPNPATTQLTLQLPVSKTSDISITDPLGKVVMRQQLFSLSKFVSLNISSLPEGAYFIVIKNDKDVYSGKFLKQ